MIRNSTFLDNVINEITQTLYEQNNLVLGNLVGAARLDLESQGMAVPEDISSSGHEEPVVEVMFLVPVEYHLQALSYAQNLKAIIMTSLNRFDFQTLGYHFGGFQIHPIKVVDWRTTRKRLFEEQLNGSIKNLVFAADGAKPRPGIDILAGTVEYNNVNQNNHLVFPNPNSEIGLFWIDLLAFWDPYGSGLGESNEDQLLSRLIKSTESSNSQGEINLFKYYYYNFKSYYKAEYNIKGIDINSRLPALLPQAYLNIDPYTKKERFTLGLEEIYREERKDFIMLMPNHRLVAIEVDGNQHYGNTTSYTKTISEDRRLQLKGYEVYRFSHGELTSTDYENTLWYFFNDLFKKHGIKFE